MSMGRNKERREAWKAANREQILAYHSEYNCRYYQAHREELLAKHSEWQRTHPRPAKTSTAEEREKWRTYARNYYHTHREKLLAKKLAYYHTHREELLYKKKCRACGVTPAIEPIAIPHPKRTYIAQQIDPRPTCDTPAIERLVADVQQLHTDITNKVAEFEKLFENWE